MNYEKYKNLFKEYYVKDQEERIEYQKVCRKKISDGKVKKPLEDQEQIMENH